MLFRCKLRPGSSIIQLNDKALFIDLVFFILCRNLPGWVKKKFPYLCCWLAIKIVSDKEIIQIPDSMKLNNITIQQDEIPETFANYFNDKINNLTETCKIKIIECIIIKSTINL